MATFRVTGPDGATYEVTAPDNASEGDVFKVLSGHIKSGQQAPQPESPGVPSRMGWQTHIGEPPKPERPALEGTVRKQPALPAAEVAMKEFGIDLTKQKDEVRSAILGLPPEKQKRAFDMWATHYANTEREGQTTGQKAAGTLSDVTEAIARGTPVGSWGDEIDAGLKSAAYKMTGGGMGAPYEEGAAWARARQKRFDTEHPVMSPALQIGGALASAPVTPMLSPFRGASMFGKIGNGIATGAAYGTAYGAGLGEDGAEDRALKAGEGLVLGGTVGGVAAPVATGLANTYKYGRDAMRPLPPALAGMSRGGVKRVNRAMQDDRLYVPTPSRGGAVPPPPGPNSTHYPSQVRALGREGMLMDMGTNLQGQASGLATKPGPGKAVVKSALETRAAGARGRIDADTSRALGPSKNLVELEDQFTKASRRQADPLYEQFRNTPIKPSENLNALLDRAKAAGIYDEALKNMQKRGFDPVDTFYKGYPSSGVNNSALNGRFLDELKRAADGKAKTFFRSGDDTQGSIYADIANGIRSEVDRIISPNNPAASVYAKARSAAGEGLQFSEAIDEGSKAFSRAVHPDRMRADMKRMNNLQREAYREGARGHLRDVMGNATSAQNTTEANLAAARDARKALGSDFARDKLRMIAAPQKYPPGAVPPPPNRSGNPEDLIRRMDAEARFAGTTHDVLSNSKTAERLAAQKEVPGTADSEDLVKMVGLRDWSGAAMQGAAKVANWLAGGAINARGARINDDMAKMLTAQGPERDRIAQGLMQFGQSRAVTQRQRDALEEILSKLLQAPRQHVIGASAF